MTTSTTPRDERCSVSHYKKVADQVAKYSIAHEQKRQYMSRDVPGNCIIVALAKYSAGAPVAEVFHWLDCAVSYQLKIYEQWNYRFDSFDSPAVMADVLAAAVLVGREKELASASAKVTADISRSPGVELLVSAITARLTKGRKPSASPAAVKDLQALGRREPDLLKFYDLFEGARSKSNAEFRKALETYLREYWTAIARHYLGYLKKPINLYFGQWCILAAALCQVRSFVPQLESDLQPYIPVELIKTQTGPARSRMA
jgi:hypothetical protein